MFCEVFSKKNMKYQASMILKRNIINNEWNKIYLSMFRVIHSNYFDKKLLFLGIDENITIFRLCSCSNPRFLVCYAGLLWK